MSNDLSFSPVLRTDAPVIIVGAGIGGLASALRLVARGMPVTVLEQHGWIGGKIRTLPSAAGPVAAGPTVLTMRHVFDDLFAEAGALLEDHVTLHADPILARHVWADGSQLDLLADPEASIDAIRAFSGARSAKEFRRFHRDTAGLFDAMDAPMMQAADPSVARLGATVMTRPGMWPIMRPGRTLRHLLKNRFSDPRLAQLFGRYATYVGGSPLASPALLALIWQAEARGVWTLKNGLASLISALAYQITQLGGEICCDCGVARLVTDGNRVTAVETNGGQILPARAVVFNGDPRALASGHLGRDVNTVASQTQHCDRSLSARVWSFAAKASGVELAHHNVFFGDDPESEFCDLAAGLMPRDPTLYICAQDRGHGVTDGPERFEIILNAPPLDMAGPVQREAEKCHQRTFPRLARMGLDLTPPPPPDTLTTPAMFDQMFPGSLGSLYGQSPHGMTAALARPRARSGMAGLYLCGGGTHPGAGVPMAALSGRHAAEAIATDLALPSTSHRTDMPGGMSTGSAMMARAPSRSSPS